MEDNLLIRGDNLDVLLRLASDYAGAVKCIYIDPPYNTRQRFKHYNDSMNSAEWLDMMRSRLDILHGLLRVDGTIWLSIDDDECHYLKVLCDEVFGRKNFVANIVWEKKAGRQNDTKWLSNSHDHILVYAKCKDIKRWPKKGRGGLNLLPRAEEMNARYKNLDNDPRGVWKPDSFSVKTYSASRDYTITTPSGRRVNPPPGICWGLTKKRFEEFVADNRIWFGPIGNNVPSIKRFLSEVQDGVVSKSIWFRTEVGDNSEAKKEIISLNSDSVFTTPKPERLIHRILHLATKPGDLVLDCFAGSGTTGAVAHKMGRRWIMVEREETIHSHIIPRLEKVIEGSDPRGITSLMNWKGGGGFKFMDWS